MKTQTKEMISVIIFGVLLILACAIGGMLFSIISINKIKHSIELQDAKFKTLEKENELLRVKIETPKNDLLECQENIGKIWEEATVVTDAYNLCKAQLNKRKK